MIIFDKLKKEKIDTGNKNPRLSKMAKRIFAFSDGLKKLREIRYFDLKMITLTYAPEYNWEKNHIRDYLRILKRKIESGLLAYAWVAELQKRGAVHYHLYCVVESGLEIPMPDKSGMWPWGMSRIETGRSVFYIASYTSKKYQKTGIFPRGLRMYAVWFKKGLLPEFDHWVFRLSAYPKWLADEILSLGRFYLGNIPRRREGGGWEIEHPNSISGHEIWVPFFSPFEILRFTSPELGQRFYHG